MLTYTQLQRDWRKSDESFPTLIEYIDYKITFIREMGKSVTYIDEQGIIHNHQGFNYYPQLKEYEIWMEGYNGNGNTSKASCIGTTLARNFQQACHILACQSFFEYATKINSEGYEGHGETSWTYDPNRLTIWGCRLFWKEELARKSFG